MTPRTSKAARIATIVIVTGMFVGAAFFTIRTLLFMRHNPTTVATVTALEQRTNDEDGSTYYVPRFNFTTPDGRSVTVTSHTGSNPAPFHVGEKIEVIYDPNNPTDARPRTFWQLFLAPVILGFLGVVWLAIYMTIALGEKRKAAAQGPHPER